jgi:type I restriction enzyme S subunit
VEKSIIPKGYKKTVAGIIPKEWDVKPFSSVLKIKHGKSSKEVEVIDGLYPVCGAGGEVGRTNSYMYKKPSILIGRKGSINKPRFIETPFWTLDTLFYSEVNIDTDPKFVYYQFCLIDWMNYNETSGLPSLNASAIEKVILPFPSDKKEQTAIANVISDVDEYIASIEKLIAKKEKIKTVIMLKLLSGKKRLSPFDKYQVGPLKGKSVSNKKSEFGIIPENWNTTTLEFLIRFSNGDAHENNISAHGKYEIVNSKFILTEGTVAKHSENCLAPVTKGSVLMVMSDIPNGKAIAKCYLVDENDKYTVNQRVCSLEPINIDSLFLFYVLNRNAFYLQFDDGVKQTNLRRQDVLDCPVLLPPLEEQQVISKVIYDLDNELKTLKTRGMKIQKIKTGMIQELFTGKTRLVMPDGNNN